MKKQKIDRKSKSKAVAAKPSTLKTKMWKCEGFEPQPFGETVWPILSKLNLKPMTKDLDGTDATEYQEIMNNAISGFGEYKTHKKEKKHKKSKSKKRK